MPASCANALRPTMALLACTCWPVSDAEKLAGGEELFGPDAGGERQPIRSNSHPHDDLFERGVAGALADAVDRALDLTDARGDRRVRIRHRQPEIVVAVRAEHRLVGVRHPGPNRS